MMFRSFCSNRWLAYLILCLLVAACNPSQPERAASAGELTVAWVQGGDLYVWRAGDDPHTAASGNIVRPLLSPDGARIAFTRGGQGETLWVVEADGSNERQIDAPPLIGQVAWLDGETLYFNTLESNPLGPIPREDLHRADISTGEITPIQPGGNFSISPDGEHIAVVHAGEYGEENGRIQVIDPLAERDSVDALDFPAVSTGATYRFYPRIQWADSETFWVAIPHPDAIYNDGKPDAPQVALWRLSVDGTREQIGAAGASFFGLPRWSADGGALVYLQRIETPNQLALYTADGDGSNPVQVARGEVGTLQPPLWLGESRRFAYIHGDALWLGEPGEEPERWLDSVLGEPVVAGTWIVFAAGRDETFELRYARIDGQDDASTLIADTGSAPVVFDAVMQSE